jgi:hypothetical protein
MFTTDARDSAGSPPTTIMIPVGISLLDPEDDEVARGLTPVTARLGPADLATLDMLITAGIAAGRAEGARWALARLREQPAYAQLSTATTRRSSRETCWSGSSSKRPTKRPTSRPGTGTTRR